MKSSVVFQLTSTGFGSSLQDKRGGKKRKTKGRSMLYVSLSKRIEVFKKKKSFSFNQKKKKKNLDCHSNTCLLNCILLCLHLLGGTCLGALSVGVSTEPCRLCCARAVMFPPREPTLSLLKCHHKEPGGRRLSSGSWHGSGPQAAACVITAFGGGKGENMEFSTGQPS